MALFTHIYFRIFCYPTENIQRVKDALFFVAFEEIIPDEINLHEMQSSRESKTPVIVYELMLEDKQFINNFEEKIRKHMSVSYLEKRIDHKCFLYLRWNKQKAYIKKLCLSENGDTIYCKAKIEVYPAKKANAVKKLGKYFS
jgi:RNA binding exosome subunit